MSGPLHGGDSNLTGRVKSTLESIGHRSLAQVDVQASEGTVVLAGIVPTFHLKQLAQEAALSVAGVAGLRNELEVIAPSKHSTAK